MLPVNYRKKPMLQIQFFARGIEKAKADEKVTIYCQLEITGYPRDTPFSTKIRLPKRFWRKNRVSKSYPLHESINNELLDIEKVLRDLWHVLPVWHPELPLTYSLIRKYFDPATRSISVKRSPSLLEVINEMIKHKNIKESTVKTYATRISNLRQFLEFKQLERVKINEVRHSFIRDFERFMVKGGRLSQNVRNKHITMIRAALEYAVDADYIEHFPMGKANLKYTPAEEPKYLDADLRKKFWSINFESLEKVRDICICLMYTGFSYTDYLSLKGSNLIEQNGKRFFKKKRNKSAIYAMPPLFPEVERKIKKYGSIENLPRIQIDDLNKELKILGDILDINEKTVGFRLSTSVFRETFTSMCQNELMLSDRVIMHFIGHSNTRQLKTYTRVNVKRVFHELERSLSWLNTG